MAAFDKIQCVAALAVCLSAAGSVAARPALAAPALQAPAEAAPAQLVVFNRPRPNWEQRAVVAPVLRAHRDLYRALADRGEIVFSGRFAGEPLLGMAIFDPGIDEAAVQRRLEADPAVAGGYVALEFRHFQVAFGALARAAGR